MLLTMAKLLVTGLALNGTQMSGDLARGDTPGHVGAEGGWTALHDGELKTLNYDLGLNQLMN